MGPALLCGWWLFAPDYSRLLSIPLGRLTLADISSGVGWALLLVCLFCATIFWLHQAWTGRDRHSWP
jgi:hypothetical protein